MLPDVTEHTRATSFAHSTVRPLVKSLPLVCAGLPVSDDSFQLKYVRLLQNYEPYVKTIGAYKENHYAQYSKENRRAQK